MKECFTQAEIAEWKPRKIANNTWRYVRKGWGVKPEEEAEFIRLHHTDIIRKDRQGRVALHSGGYRTVTTKDRINRFSPYRIYSKRGVWYVLGAPKAGETISGDGIPFYEGIVLPDAFKKAPPKAVKGEDRLRSQVARMLKKLDKQPTLPQPSPGDCLFCQIAAQPGHAQRLNNDCVREHLKENYLHGSLLVRAVLARSYGDPAVVWHMRTHGWSEFSEGKRTGKNYYKGDMKRDLKRFLCQAVGI
jgi:hypothetical protein